MITFLGVYMIFPDFHLKGILWVLSACYPQAPPHSSRYPFPGGCRRRKWRTGSVPVPLAAGVRNQTPKMAAAAAEDRMAEEGGGSHGDGGSSLASGSTQRQPPPPPPQHPQPGSQALPAPALAPDQLPQNNTLVALPIVAIENILSFMSYDEISQLRLVRPLHNSCLPLPPAEVWEGRRRERVPRGGIPPLAPAGYRSGRAPLRFRTLPCSQSAGVGWFPVAS